MRCNRAAYGFWAGDRWYPLLEGSDPRDLAVRDAFLMLLADPGTPLAAGKRLVTERFFAARLADGSLPRPYRCAV